MPFQGDELYHNQDEILAAMMSAFQSAIPDIWLGEDGTLRIILEIEAGQIEGLYLSNQLALEDMFIQTASLAGLQRFGEMLGVPQIAGTPSVGSLLFAGSGGTYIPIGTEVAFDPGGGADVLYFVNIVDGTIPSPGIPTSPTAADAGAGALSAGTYEYAVSFVTVAGETTIGAISNALIIAASHNITLTNIPLGGVGTTARKLYRRFNGGAWGLIDAASATLANNTTTTVTDSDTTPTSSPLTTSTAEQIALNAQSEQNGLEYNAVAGSITILTNVPDGLTSVINNAPFAGGSDVELIDDYRVRLLNWIRSPQTGSSSDLVGWAETVTGVSRATAYPGDNLGTPTIGHVTIRIAGPNGSIPGSDVVAATLALLQTKTLASITIHVGTFTPLSEDVTVTIYPASGFTTAGLMPSVQVAIISYINSIDVGGTLYLSGIVQALKGLAGILDVTITLPVSNLVAGSTQKFTSGTITVNGTP